MTTERASFVSEAAVLSALVCAASMGGCSGEAKVAASTNALVAVCAEADAGLPAGEWLCPASRTVECDGGDGTAAVDWIYVIPPSDDAGGSCVGRDVVVNDPGPFAVGTHAISVTQPGPDGGVALLCSAELVVVDTEPPVAEVKTIVLWPPDHRMHTITPDDCVAVEDRCDGVLEAHFTGVTSNEPDDALGDGQTANDAVNHGDSAEVRAERAGGGSGRVYEIAYEAVDTAGNKTVGTCIVEVPHDASGLSHDGDAGCEGDEHAPDGG